MTKTLPPPIYEEDTSLTDNNKNIDKKRHIKTDNNEKQKKERTAEAVGIMRAVPVILIAAALFLTLCYITADTGAFGAFISSALLGLFSYMAYTIPFFISLHALFYFSDLRCGKVTKRVIFSVAALIMLSMTAYVISTFKTEAVFDLGTFYSNGIERIGGGAIGSALAFALMKVFGRIGLIILLTLALVVYVIYLASGGGSAISNFFLKKLRSIANYGANLEKRAEEKRRRKKEGKEAKHRAFDDKKNRDFYNDEYFSTDNGVSRLEIPELGILEMKNTVGTAHILRETVIKNIEEEEETPTVTPEESEAAFRKSKFNDIFIDTEASFVRMDGEVQGFRSDDIVYEAREKTEDDIFAANDSATKSARDYGIDDSADAVFTADFDPYDLALNEKRRNKASSRARENADESRGFSEYIASMTPEEIEHLKRLERFEEGKKAAIARRAEAEAEANAKVTAAPVAFEEAVPEADVRADALRKAEETRLAEQALLANYGFGSSTEKKEEPKREETYRSTESSAHSFGTNVANETKSTAYTSTYDERPKANESDRYRFVNNVSNEVRIPYTASTPVAHNDHGYGTANENKTSYTTPATNYSAPTENMYKPEYSAPSNNSSTPEYSAPVGSAYKTEEAKPQYSSYDSPVTNNEVKNGYEEKSTEEYRSAQESQPKYSITVDVTPDADTQPKSNLRFIEVDGYEADDVPITENSKEFNFDTTEDQIVDDFAPIEAVGEDDNERLEVSRSMVEPELEAPVYEEKVGLDFSLDDGDDVDDDEGDFTEADIEEPVEPTLIPEEERNPDVDNYRKMFNIFNDENEDDKSNDDVEEDYSADDNEPTEEYDVTVEPEKEPEDDEPPFDVEPEEFDDFEPVAAPTKKVVEKTEKPKAPKPDYSNYKLPPLDLLKKSPEEDWDTINREIQYGGDMLINTLDSFNIKATIRGMEHGPRITRYSIVPAKGIRVSQIEKLSDDIALALAAESIRIEAPIPGKAAVGVEVPNKVSSLVTLRDLLESDEFMNEPSKTSVCIGKSVEGSLVYGDIGSMPHALIAGATGMGKSVCINALITSILYKARPDEVKFIMIDPKKVEFAPYTGLPHLLIPVVTDPKQAAGALMWAVDEMNKRYEIIEKLRVKNIDSYNRKICENPELGAPMSKIIIFIDELNDLMVQVRDPVENLIMLLAQKSRAAGIHLVIGTQRPSVDVLTGVIKANIPTRIACKVSSGIDSRTILEKTGAEKLIGKGDMLFAVPGKEPKRVQGAFVSDGETEAIVDFIKAQVGGEVYDEQALEDIKRAAQKCDKSKNGDDDIDDDDDEGSGIGYLHDRKFLNAVELAVRNGSVATSFLQRKLHIGYGKAAQYIDIMEDLGIVGEKNGSKARDVLITMDEWNEKLSRLTEDY